MTDFGLAKVAEADGGLTGTHAVLGTPSYMAPEQARGDARAAAAAADVYALGAILYRLVTGRPPFTAATRAGVLEQVIRDDPPAPSTLVPGLPRDIETVILKCLRKGPADRYPTAADVADDLRRWRDQKPILARPAGRVEKAWKAARRNAALVGGTAAVIAALGVGAGVATWQAVRATAAEGAAAAQLARALAAEEAAGRDRDAAQTEAAHARAAEATASDRQRAATAAKEFLQRVLEQAGAQAQTTPDPNLTVRAALARAATEMTGRFDDQPLIEADLRHTIGLAFKRMGLLPAAEPQYRRELALREAASGPDHPDTLATVADLAVILVGRGEYAAAEPLHRRALAGFEAIGGPDHPDAVTITQNLGVLYVKTGRLKDAEPMLKRGLAGREKRLGPGHPDTLSSASNLGSLYRQTGRLKDAEPLLLRAVAGREKLFGPDHPDTLTSVAELGGVYLMGQRFADAERLYRRALAGFEKVLGPDHPDAADAANNLGVLCLNAGRFADAVPFLARASAGLTTALGRTHRKALSADFNLAGAYYQTGRKPDAEAIFRRVLAAREATLGPDHPETLEATSNLAYVYVASDRRAEAEPLYRRALAGFTDHYGSTDSRTLAAVVALFHLYRENGDHAAAEPLAVRALAGRDRTLGPDHEATQTSVFDLAVLYAGTDRGPRAVPLFARYVAAARRQNPENSVAVTNALSRAALYLLAAGQFAAAEGYAREALAVRQAVDPDGWPTHNLRSLLGGALLGQGQAAEAEPLLLAGYTGLMAKRDYLPVAARPRVAEAVNRLIAASDALGRPADAAKWRAVRRTLMPEVGPPPRAGR